MIVRSLRFTSLVMPAPPRDQHCYVKAVFHANVTNRDLGTRHTHSFVEVWTFSRIPTAAHATDDYEWYVDSVVLKTQQREPPAPAADVQFDQSEPEVRRPFAKAVPAPHAQPVSSDDVIARTTFIFAELIRFWTDENLEPLRPLMTNRLFHSVAYRLMDYRTKDLRNAIVGAQVTHAEVVRSSRDRRFDIATVRIRRSERNFTVRRKSGAIIAGNNAESHVYDEDWTLLRSTDQPGALWVLSRIDRAP